MFPLHDAARAGNVEDARRVIANAHGDINRRDVRGHTPLHVAASWGRREIVELLLGTAGIDVNAKDSRGDTPLLKAAAKDHTEVVRLLVESSAQNAVSDVNNEGKSVLHVAAAQGRIGVVELLLASFKSKIDLNAKDKQERTALHNAVWAGQVEVVEILISDSGVDLIAKDVDGQTALHLAATKGNSEIVALLMESSGVLVSEKNNAGKTALHCAAEEGRVDVIKILLKHSDVRLTGTDNEGFTPAGLAMKNQKGDALTTLLEAKGGSASQVVRGSFPDSEGSPISCIDHLVYNDDDETAEQILNHCLQVSKIHDTHQFIVDFRCLTKDIDGTLGIEPEHNLFNRTLRVIVEKRSERVLLHPVVLSLIRHKWQTVRWLYHIYGILLMSFAILLSFHVGISTNLATSAAQNATTSVVDDSVNEGKARLPGIATATTVFAALLLGKEFVQFVCEAWIGSQEKTRYHASQHGGSILCSERLLMLIFCILKYLLNMCNLIQIFAYSSALGYLWGDDICAELDLSICKYWWEVGAFSILATWMAVLYYLRVLVPGGIFVIMFVTVLTNYTKHIVFFFILLLGFALSFHMLFINLNWFGTFHDAYLKTIVMFSGEFDYDTMFFQSGPVLTAARVLMPAFIFMIYVVIQNLLMGIALGDINTIRRQAEFTKLKMITFFCIDMEESFFGKLCKMGYRAKVDSEGDSKPKLSEKTCFFPLALKLAKIIYPDELIIEIPTRHAWLSTRLKLLFKDAHKQPSNNSFLPAKSKEIKAFRKNLCRFMWISFDEPEIEPSTQGEKEDTSGEIAALRSRLDRAEVAIKYSIDTIGKQLGTPNPGVSEFTVVRPMASTDRVEAYQHQRPQRDASTHLAELKHCVEQQMFTLRDHLEVLQKQSNKREKRIEKSLLDVSKRLALINDQVQNFSKVKDS